MLPIKKRRRLIVLLSLVAVSGLGFDLITRHLHAKEPTPKDAAVDNLREAEVVSDLSAEEMAREILVLQEQLGGSIVPKLDMPSQEPPHWRNQGNSPVGNALITDQEPWHTRHAQLPARHGNSVMERKRIEVLRETAFNLDRMAHDLEQLELYGQADSVRETGHRLRHDARNLKQQMQSSHRDPGNTLQPRRSTRPPGR